MPQRLSKAVPQGNGSVPQQEEFGSVQPTLANVYRLFEERFDRHLEVMKSHFDKLDELADEMRTAEKHSASLEQNARQPRLAKEANATAEEKTHARMKGALAVQAKHGDSSSANQVDPDPMCLTSFGHDFTGPPALL